MDIVSWNVNSVGARLPLVLDWLATEQPDVLCLQETKSPDPSFPRAAFEALGYHVAFSGQKSYNGVAILSKHPLQAVTMGLPYDETTGQRRLIAATIQGIHIINVYIPNGSEVGSEKFQYKLGWLAAFREFLESYDPQTPVVVCGDFNICPGPLDVFDVAAMTNQVGYHPEERPPWSGFKPGGLWIPFAPSILTAKNLAGGITGKLLFGVTGGYGLIIFGPPPPWQPGVNGLGLTLPPAN